MATATRSTKANNDDGTKNDTNTEPTLREVLNAVKLNGLELKQLHDDSAIKFDTILGDISKFKTQNTALQKRVNTNETILRSVTFEVEMLKQRQLQNNISIGGIPTTADENIVGIFVNICEILGIRSDVEGFICGIYRTMGKSNAIIVQLTNEGLKTAILEKKV